MTYGLQIFNSAGTITFDSTTAYGGCVVDIVPIIPNSGAVPVYNTGTQTGVQVRSYPNATFVEVVLFSGTPSTSSLITISGNTVTFPPLDHFSSDFPPEVYLVIAT